MGPASEGVLSADLPYTPLARRTLELTTSEALRLGGGVGVTAGLVTDGPDLAVELSRVTG